MTDVKTLNWVQLQDYVYQIRGKLDSKPKDKKLNKIMKDIDKEYKRRGCTNFAIPMP